MMRQVRSAVSALAAAAIVLFAACDDDDDRPLTGDELAVVRAWLTCDDCMDGERARVAALGPAAQPYLEDVLARVPNSFHDNLRRQYAQLYAMVPTAAIDSTTFVNRYLASFDVTVQTRAAASLHDLRAWSAIEEALDSAASRGYAPEVVATLEAHLLAAGQGVRDETGPADTWLVSEPATAIEVCNGLGAIACTESRASAIVARATGPSGVFANPWDRVYFFWRRQAESAATLIGQAGAPVVTDNGLERRFEWSLTYSPQDEPPGSVQIVAIGLTPAGEAFRTPPNERITVIDGR